MKCVSEEGPAVGEELMEVGQEMLRIHTPPVEM